MKNTVRFLVSVGLLVFLSAAACNTKEQMAENIVTKCEGLLQRVQKEIPDTLPPQINNVITLIGLDPSNLQTIGGNIFEVYKKDLKALSAQLVEACNESELAAFNDELDFMNDALGIALALGHDLWTLVETNDATQEILSAIDRLVTYAKVEGLDVSVQKILRDEMDSNKGTPFWNRFISQLSTQQLFEIKKIFDKVDQNKLVSLQNSGERLIAEYKIKFENILKPYQNRNQIIEISAGCNDVIQSSNKKMRKNILDVLPNIHHVD